MSEAIAAHLVVDDPERAAQWYASVFGARETDRIPLPDGTVFAIDLSLGATTIALAGEYPDQGIISPKTLGGTYLALVVATDNADEVWTRAINAGATAFHPIADTFYGERAGQFHRPVRTPLGRHPAPARRAQTGTRRGRGRHLRSGLSPRTSIATASSGRQQAREGPSPRE
jgi:PhnB protein